MTDDLARNMAAYATTSTLAQGEIVDLLKEIVAFSTTTAETLEDFARRIKALEQAAGS